MEPTEVSARLRQLASYLSRSPRPSVSFVKEKLSAVLLATDRSFSDAVATALATQVAALLPEEFDGTKYDTSQRGKGYKGGYVSWAMDPNTWESAGIIGGILFMCKYDTEAFSSEAPDEGGEWGGHSKGEAAVTLSVTAGYYNKTYGGGVDEKVDLGTCTVLLDPKENVTEAEVDDKPAFKDGLAGLIKRINDSPPDEAVSEGRKKRALPPSTSPKALLTWLTRQNRTDVKRTELNDLVRSVSERTGRPVPNVLEDANKFFKSRGWPVDERG